MSEIPEKNTKVKKRDGIYVASVEYGVPEDYEHIPHVAGIPICLDCEEMMEKNSAGTRASCSECSTEYELISFSTIFATAVTEENSEKGGTE